LSPKGPVGLPDGRLPQHSPGKDLLRTAAQGRESDTRKVLRGGGFGGGLGLDACLLRVAPEDVRKSMQFLGERLREARLRRNTSVEQVADLLKVNRKTIAEAEQGNPRTSAGVYAGILWALGIGEQLDDLATVEREYEELRGDDGRKRASRRRK